MNELVCDNFYFNKKYEGLLDEDLGEKKNSWKVFVKDFKHCQVIIQCRVPQLLLVLPSSPCLLFEENRYGY